MTNLKQSQVQEGSLVGWISAVVGKICGKVGFTME